MAIIITPTNLPDINSRPYTTNETITASGTAGEQNISVTISYQDPADLDNQLNLTLGESGAVATVVGTWDDPFSDQFTYVEKGTTYPKTPVTVTKVTNMPSDKLMYDLNQDSTVSVTKGLFMTVSYEDVNGVAQPNVSFYPEVILNNDYEGIRSFISNYYT